jgi:hypothetical protein
LAVLAAVKYCNLALNHLLLGTTRLASACGVQRGVLFGPLLFALAIHDAVLNACGLIEQRHLADDCVIAGMCTLSDRFVVPLRRLP